jgi:hypothetical protein
VERPLRLNFQASGGRLARLGDEAAFRNLAVSRRKGAAREREETEGRKEQERILAMLRTVPDTVYKDRGEFEHALDAAARKSGLRLTAPVKKAILSALSERDDTAAICRDATGRPEPDPDLGHAFANGVSRVLGHHGRRYGDDAGLRELGVRANAATRVPALSISLYGTRVPAADNGFDSPDDLHA